MRIQLKASEFQIVEDLSRSKPHDRFPPKYEILLNREILLNPEMRQKVRFGNEDGHDIHKILTIRPENGCVHTIYFV